MSLHTQSGVQGSVRISGGAVTLNAFGQTQRGIGSLTYQSKGLGDVTDSYEIEVNGGACTVTWDATTESP